MGAHRGERVERAGLRLGDHDLLVGQDLTADAARGVTGEALNVSAGQTMV